MFGINIPHSKKKQKCPREAIEWAAKRIGISYGDLQSQITDDDRVAINRAYEAWIERTQEAGRLLEIGG